MFQFNFTTVFITNLIGVINLLAIFIANRHWLIVKTNDTVSILIMMQITLLSCIIDPITYALDGKSGGLIRFLLYVGNTWLYLSYILLATCGICFAINHIGIRNKKLWYLFCTFILLSGFDLLCINFVVPIVFVIDYNNVFSRMKFAGLFFGFLSFAAVIGNAMYLQIRGKQELRTFFPLGFLAFPLLVGTLIQYFHYGISILWACEAISVSIVVASIKNESLYKDRLTGFYNHYYLDYIWAHIRVKKNQSLYYITLEIKDFRTIRKTYGYQTAESLLKETAELIRNCMDNKGICICLEAEKYLILFSFENESGIHIYQDKLLEACNAYNHTNTKLYHLDAIMQSGICNMKEMELNEFFDKIEPVCKSANIQTSA